MAGDEPRGIRRTYHFMLRFPVICSGGIGDTLIKLAAVPIAAWGRLGVRFNLFYSERGHPAWKVLEGFLASLEYCRLVARPPSLTEMRIRNLWKRVLPYSSVLYAPPIPQREVSDSHPASAKRILLQSHLDGHHGHTSVWAKKWPVNRWCELAKSLHRDGWAVELLEWDPPSFEAIVRACPFIQDARRRTLLETVQRMRAASCVVSVDSWTKYVAGWWKIPQVVIVADLRKGYTPDFQNMTADQVARGWFRGLTGSPTTRLLGLEKKRNGFEYTLPSLELLSVQQVKAAVIQVSNSSDFEN